MDEYLKRILKLLFGLILYAFGLVLSINANIGLAPWDTFNVGISQVTDISIGNASILIGILILIIVVGFKRKNWYRNYSKYYFNRNFHGYYTVI